MEFEEEMKMRISRERVKEMRKFKKESCFKLKGLSSDVKCR